MTEKIGETNHEEELAQEVFELIVNGKWVNFENYIQNRNSDHGSHQSQVSQFSFKMRVCKLENYVVNRQTDY